MLLAACSSPPQGVGIALTLKLSPALDSQKLRINRLTFVTSGDETNSEALDLRRAVFADGEERLYYRPLKTTRNLTLLVGAWETNTLIASGTVSLSINPDVLTPAMVTLTSSGQPDDMGLDFAFNNKDLTLGPDQMLTPISFSAAASSSLGSNSPSAIAPGRFIGSPELPRGSAMVAGNKILWNTRGCELDSNSPSQPTGMNAVALAGGDFNGDGHTDYAVANKNSNTVSILLSDAFGGFAAPTNLDVGLQPIDIIVNYLNNDGILDFATLNAESRTITIYYGAGNGAFGAPIAFSIGTGTVNALASGNVYNQESPGNDFVVASSTGVRTFFLDRRFNTYGEAGAPEAVNVTDVAVADLNGDNIAEVVAVLPDDNRVAVYLNLMPIQKLDTTQPSLVLLADFNRDDRTDLAVGNGTGFVTVYGGLGNGNFQFTNTYALPTAPVALAAAEFISTTVGKFDLVALTGSTCSVLANVSP